MHQAETTLKCKECGAEGQTDFGGIITSPEVDPPTCGRVGTDRPSQKEKRPAS